MSHLVAVYGSLKKGFYNHGGLGEDAEFLGNSSVSAVMYSNGSYPKLYHSTGHKVMDNFDLSKTRVHELEVYSISDARFQGIERMEHGAGYVSELIDTEWGPATIYYMPHERFSGHDTWVEAYKRDGIAARF